MPPAGRWQRTGRRRRRCSTDWLVALRLHGNWLRRRSRSGSTVHYRARRAWAAVCHRVRCARAAVCYRTRRRRCRRGCGRRTCNGFLSRRTALFADAELFARATSGRLRAPRRRFHRSWLAGRVAGGIGRAIGRVVIPESKSVGHYIGHPERVTGNAGGWLVKGGPVSIAAGGGWLVRWRRQRVLARPATLTLDRSLRHGLLGCRCRRRRLTVTRARIHGFTGRRRCRGGGQIDRGMRLILIQVLLIAIVMPEVPHCAPPLALWQPASDHPTDSLPSKDPYHALPNPLVALGAPLRHARRGRRLRGRRLRGQLLGRLLWLLRLLLPLGQILFWPRRPAAHQPAHRARVDESVRLSIVPAVMPTLHRLELENLLDGRLRVVVNIKLRLGLLLGLRLVPRVAHPDEIVGLESLDANRLEDSVREGAAAH